MKGAIDRNQMTLVSRRDIVKALGAVAGAALAADALLAQQRPEPPSTITNPPRDFDAADDVLHRSGHPDRRPVVQRATSSRKTRSGGCGRAGSGSKGRRGAA